MPPFAVSSTEPTALQPEAAIASTLCSQPGIPANVTPVLLAALYAALVKKFPSLQIQASGGVASLADLRVLKTTGSAGAIVGVRDSTQPNCRVGSPTSTQPYRLRLQTIEADRVGNPNNAADSPTQVAGVRLNALGVLCVDFMLQGVDLRVQFGDGFLIAFQCGLLITVHVLIQTGGVFVVNAIEIFSPDEGVFVDNPSRTVIYP